MKTLFPYQVDAIEQLREGVRRGHRRMILVMLMGAGKTITALDLMRACVDMGKRAVFISDRRMLVDQALKEAWEYGLESGVVMAGRGHNLNAPAQILSKATAASWIKNNKIDVPESDLVIVDEAHRATTEEWRWLMDRWPNAILVGLSATPVHGDGSNMGDVYTWIVDPIKPSELLARGRVVRVRYFAPCLPDLKGVRSEGRDKDYSLTQLASRMNQQGMIGDVVPWWNRLAEGRPSVYYCCDQAHCRAVAAEFLAAGIKAEIIIDDTDDAEREAIKARMQAGETKVVVNCDVMCEGINWPFLAVCGLLRPTKRFRRYLQMVGRVMRADDGKNDSLVIDHAGCCLFHGFANRDINWSLDRTSNIDDAIKRDRKAKPESFPHLCKECHGLFTGRVCPYCGAVYEGTRKVKGRKHINGVLVEVSTDDDLTGDALKLAQQRYWYTCIAASVKRNARAGLAVTMFKTRFGCMPWHAGVVPLAENWQQMSREAFPGFVPKVLHKTDEVFREHQPGLFS